MTIYFNAAKEASKPNSLSVKHDRVMEKDTIHLTECLWSVSETKISLIGILGSDCTGIENYDDKSFKLEGKKVAFSFLRDDNPVYNKETRQTTIEPAGDEQKLVFEALRASLEKLTASNAVCASAVMKPAANTIHLQLYRSPDPAQKALLSQFTTSMFVFVPVEPKELTRSDTDFINALVAQKPGEFKKMGSGGTYKPAETEAEKLQARLAFIKAQMPILKSETVLDMYLELKCCNNPDFEQAFAVIVRIIGGSK